MLITKIHATEGISKDSFLKILRYLLSIKEPKATSPIANDQVVKYSNTSKLNKQKPKIVHTMQAPMPTLLLKPWRNLRDVIFYKTILFIAKSCDPEFEDVIHCSNDFFIHIDEFEMYWIR